MGICMKCETETKNENMLCDECIGKIKSKTKEKEHNENMMYCPDCGKQISKRAVICPNCGRSFRKETDKKEYGLGVTALIFCIFIPLAGFILGIAGIIKEQKYSSYAVYLSVLITIFYAVIFLNILDIPRMFWTA